jgi:hypothetical protein
VGSVTVFCHFCVGARTKFAGVRTLSGVLAAIFSGETGPCRWKPQFFYGSLVLLRSCSARSSVVQTVNCEPKGDRHIPSPRRGLSVQYVKACFCFWGWCLSCYPAGCSIFAIGSIGARSYIVEVYYIYLWRPANCQNLSS